MSEIGFKSRLTALFAAAVCLTAASVLIPTNNHNIAEAAIWPFAKKERDESRTLSLYFTHTKESLTITYKRNGRYIPTAMKKLNWFLRDWRRDKATTMDPKTIDLMWELHADLGSNKPIHIISAFRSPQTNAMLKRIGRRVARRSMHIQGKAIDLYFPDVPTSRIRNSALVRKIGGVGFYPRSGKHGFVHIDSGRVRHWPRMSPTRLAKVMRENRKTIGARFQRGPLPVIAANNQQPPQQVSALAPLQPTVITPAPARPKARPAEALARVIVPKPRPRPMEVLALAASMATITPASAPVPKRNYAANPSLVRNNIGAVTSMTSLVSRVSQQSNRSAKGSFADAIRTGTTNEAPLLKPLDPDATNVAGLSNEWLESGDSATRRDGAPQPFVVGAHARVAALPAVATLGEEDSASLRRMIASVMPGNWIEPSKPTQRTSISGKSDMLIVNRSSKGDMSSARGKKKARTIEGASLVEPRFTQGVAIDLNPRRGKNRIVGKADLSNN